jgi:F-type H+-transporting ATPase subunit delta
MLITDFPEYIETLLKDLKKIDSAFKNETVRNFFLNILIPNNDKSEVFKKVVSKSSKTSKNLLLFLAERGRYDIIVDLYNNLNEGWKKVSGVIKGDLIFPNKPDKKIIKSSLNILKSIMGKDVDYEIKIDKSVLGGFVFRSDEVIVDISAKYQLQKLKDVVLK